MKREVICPKCSQLAKCVKQSLVYKTKTELTGYCYWCKKCDTLVGCHPHTKVPLGTMADRETRQWRMRAHNAFDTLWKLGFVKRDEAYSILKKEFGREIHIGESDIETCQKIINLITK